MYNGFTSWHDWNKSSLFLYQLAFNMVLVVLEIFFEFFFCSILQDCIALKKTTGPG